MTIKDEKKPIKIAFTDTDRFIHPALLKVIQSNFHVEVDDVNPDFVFFSIFPGFEFMRYPNAIRVFQSEENIQPDFNLCDFGFGFANMKFSRYFRLPNYYFFSSFKGLSQFNWKTSLQNKDRFCNYIYSNQHADPMREKLFRALNEYKFVHSHGRHLNNAEPLGVGTAEDGWSLSKLEVQQRYKFSIVCENSSTPGYTTEKITDAIYSGTIPIYWGNPEIGQEFNLARIVNVHDFDSINSVVEHVKYLDTNNQAFINMISQPVFTRENKESLPTEKKLVDFLQRIFSCAMPQRNMIFWGRWYEERLKNLLDSSKQCEVLGQEVKRLQSAYSELENQNAELVKTISEHRNRRWWNFSR